MAQSRTTKGFIAKNSLKNLAFFCKTPKKTSKKTQKALKKAFFVNYLFKNLLKVP